MDRILCLASTGRASPRSFLHAADAKDAIDRGDVDVETLRDHVGGFRFVGFDYGLAIYPHGLTIDIPPHAIRSATASIIRTVKSAARIAGHLLSACLMTRHQKIETRTNG